MKLKKIKYIRIKEQYEELNSKTPKLKDIKSRRGGKPKRRRSRREIPKRRRSRR